MPFQFPLATVLRVRMLREEREERLLQQILFQIAQAGTRLEALQVQLSHLMSRRADLLRHKQTAVEILGLEHETAALYRRRDELMRHMEQMEELRDRQMALYHDARRDRQMLADLHDRKRSAYDITAARAEQRRVDAMTVLRHRRADA